MNEILVCLGLVACIVIGILVAELYKLRLYRSRRYKMELSQTVEDITEEIFKEVAKMMPKIEKTVEKMMEYEDNDE